MILVEDEGKRSRRSTRFSGDFHTKFDAGSSDDEMDSDGGPSKKKRGPRASTGASATKVKRTKECPGCGAKHTLSVKECNLCDYQFTSKSMLMSNQSAAEESQSIRDKFPFEPEREEDGSLLIQAIIGRRPRQTSHRWPKTSGGVGAFDSKYEYDYLIKFKNLSYLHTKWLNASEIETMNQKSRQILYRYLSKIDRGEIVSEEVELDSSFTEVEKILDVREEEVEETVDDAVEKPEQSVDDRSENIERKGKSREVDGSTGSKRVASEENLTQSYNEQEEAIGDESMIAKSSFKVFGHVERCRMLLNRIWDDPYAASFRDPVDTTEYDDYLDVVDEPICLSDVKEKLENGEYSKYFQHMKFANDMRKIWRNCKIYNLYQSQIWYSAHALSLMFERLFQGWVVSYADGLIDIDDPVGRPWEPTCRVCLDDSNDEDLMLCDHCDAAYHIYCLKPKLKQVPDGPWICNRCTAWFAKTGKKMLSATAEDEARQYAEGAKTRKVVKVRKKKYLVKWRGLSYRDCTWETAEDINDDERIAEYHKVNDNPPEEPPLTKAEIGYELSKDRRVPILPAMRQSNPIMDLDAIVYAQIRAYHFLKWRKVPPSSLLRESGPATLGYVHGMKRSMLIHNHPNLQSPEEKEKENYDNTCTDKWLIPCDSDPVRNEVLDVLSDIVYMVGRMAVSIPRDPYPARPKLPSPHRSPSEFEICVPRRSKGSYGLQICNYLGYATIIGMRRDGNPNDRGYIEISNRVKYGDIIVAIDGVYINGVNYGHVLNLLRQKVSQNYTYIRFLRLPVADDDSSGPYAIKEYFDNKPAKEYLRPHPLRSKYFGVFPSPTKLSGEQSWYSEYYSNKKHKSIRLGEYSTEIDAAHAYDAGVRASNENKLINFENGSLTFAAKRLGEVVEKERSDNIERLSKLKLEGMEVAASASTNAESKEEQKYAERKDDDENSYDSRDSDTEIASESTLSESERSDDEDDKVNHWTAKESDEEYEYKPKKTEATLVESDGPMGRLLRAVNESDYPPAKVEWQNYLLEQFPLEVKANVLNKRKRILQIDMATQNVIREWDNIADIARNLGIQSVDIQAVIMNKKDTAGGFIWRYSSAISSNTKSQEDDGDNQQSMNAEDGDNLAETSKNKGVASWKTKLYSTSKEYRSGGKLRDYQVDGLNWLLSCWYSKRSSILADEMGLGKTVQVVSFLEHIFEIEKIRGPFLVCVPLSTIQHWKREAEAWTNMITCLYHDAGGGRDMRDIIREFEWYYKGHSRRLLKFHLLITTYDDLIRDYEELAEIPWRVVVVDEAHRLRNLNSKLLECMRSVVSKGMVAYGYQHRILMTGTPLQNNTTELWTLLNFIEPAKFPNIEKFNERYGHISTQEQVESLQQRLAPHLLRRVKEDVAKDIPPKEETIIDVELTTIQKQYYRAIFEKNHSFLLQNLKGTVPKLMNIQMELRKCCNHPFLVDGVEQIEMEQLDNQLANEGITDYLPSASKNTVVQTDTSNELSATSHHLASGRRSEFERRRMEQFVIPTSGKMVLIDKLLPKLQKENHRVLIFSQMVKMIDIIDEYCEYRGYPCERLDGRISGNERQKAIDRFNTDKKSFVFLLSTRAGGVGINLTAADTVIIFDSDWNPQNDVQAMARCHRIGQQKSVTIYRLITRRSFEASMFERASKKLGLEHAVLGSRQFSDIEGNENANSNLKMDGKELEQLLKEGAYSVLLEDNSEEIKEFFDQDIEKLLEQRAHVMVAETTATESWLNKKNKFKTKKSLFTGDLAMEHAEIDVNDPNFWKKVLPDLVTPESLLERLSDLRSASAIEEEEENEQQDGNENETEVVEEVVPVKKRRGRKPRNGIVNTTPIKKPKRKKKSSEDDGFSFDTVEKFSQDLGQMMEGMLDLKNRGQLPEQQRDTCMKLLLRVSLKDEIFPEEMIAQAKEWLSFMEGTRRRVRLENVRNISPDVKLSKKLKGRMHEKRGRPPKSKLKANLMKSRNKSMNDEDIDEDDEDEDMDDDEMQLSGRKSSSMKNSRNSRSFSDIINRNKKIRNRFKDRLNEDQGKDDDEDNDEEDEIASYDDSIDNDDEEEEDDSMDDNYEGNRPSKSNSQEIRTKRKYTKRSSIDSKAKKRKSQSSMDYEDDEEDNVPSHRKSNGSDDEEDDSDDYYAAKRQKRSSMNTAGKSNKQEIIEDIDEEDEEDDFIGSAANVSDDLISDDVRRQIVEQRGIRLSGAIASEAGENREDDMDEE